MLRNVHDADLRIKLQVDKAKPITQANRMTQRFRKYDEDVIRQTSPTRAFLRDTHHFIPILQQVGGPA